MKTRYKNGLEYSHLEHEKKFHVPETKVEKLKNTSAVDDIFSLKLIVFEKLLE